MDKDKKLFHLHLKDGFGNAETLICKLINGSIRYTYFTGTTDSGGGLCLSNIQFYEKTFTDGKKHLHWDKNLSLPIENLDGETEGEFKNRVLSMLDNSTSKVIKDINTKVAFANGEVSE